MSLTEASRVAVVDVGTPPASGANGLSTKEWECVDVRVHGFRDLDVMRGNCVSSRFRCVGTVWELRVYPHGDIVSDEGMVDIDLVNLDDHCIWVEYSVSIKGKDGEVHHADSAGPVTFEPDDPWLCYDVQRTKILEDLVDGTLVVQVRMCTVADGSQPLPPKPFVADNPLPQLILEQFMDEESSDLTIEVTSTSESAATGTKKAKTSATFHAHRFILQQCTSALGDLCKAGGDSTPVRISDVEPQTFRHLLYYAYGGKIDDEDLEKNAKDIIDAANKYGVVGLKLEAEASYVSTMSITIENLMDNLLYADSKNCALLKEAVMDFLVKNWKEATEKLSFDIVPGSLMKDLLTAVGAASSKESSGTDSNDFATMKVCTLRKMLHEKGLPIDGSREAMIVLLRSILQAQIREVL
ncbi:hypothetical protein ACHAWF_013205 [Thalassiosira exigua]